MLNVPISNITINRLKKNPTLYESIILLLKTFAIHSAKTFKNKIDQEMKEESFGQNTNSIIKSKHFVINTM
jgi:hypothetical protein